MGRQIKELRRALAPIDRRLAARSTTVPAAPAVTLAEKIARRRDELRTGGPKRL
jgi:hypothetical protein